MESFTEHFGKLLSLSGRVAAKDKLRIFQGKLGQPLVLQLGLLDIVCDWKSVYPVVAQLLSHLGTLLYVVLLELEDFADASNRVVSSMIKLGRFSLFLLDFSGHLVFDSEFKRLETVFSLSSERMSTVSCNHTDSVSSSLSKTGTRIVNKIANSRNNGCVVSWREVVGPQVFNHVVQYKKTKLLSLLYLTSEGFV